MVKKIPGMSLVETSGEEFVLMVLLFSGCYSLRAPVTASKSLQVPFGPNLRMSPVGEYT
jgi:hypothetical protein